MDISQQAAPLLKADAVPVQANMAVKQVAKTTKTSNTSSKTKKNNKSSTRRKTSSSGGINYVPLKLDAFNNRQVKYLYRDCPQDKHSVMLCYMHVMNYIYAHGGYVKFDMMLIKIIADQMDCDTGLVDVWIKKLVRFDFFDLRCFSIGILTSYDIQMQAYSIAIKFRTNPIKIPLKYLLIPFQDRVEMKICIDKDNREVVTTCKESDYDKMCELFHGETELQMYIDDHAECL